MLAYLCWCVLVGLEADIKLSFMVVGHTRCAVDGGFGVVKKKIRSSDTDTACQLVDLVNPSGLRNTATLCDWQWRSWDSFFMNDFKRVVGMQFAKLGSRALANLNLSWHFCGQGCFLLPGTMLWFSLSRYQALTMFLLTVFLVSRFNGSSN